MFISEDVRCSLAAHKVSFLNQVRLKEEVHLMPLVNKNNNKKVVYTNPSYFNPSLEMQLVFLLLNRISRYF